jgi:hypothetical protein
MTVFGELQAAQVDVSPELALVDPSLAACARATLPAPGDMLRWDELRADPDREQTVSVFAHHVSVMEAERAAALRRITELSEVEPPEPRSRYRREARRGSNDVERLRDPHRGSAVIRLAFLAESLSDSCRELREGRRPDSWPARPRANECGEARLAPRVGGPQ